MTTAKQPPSIYQQVKALSSELCRVEDAAADLLCQDQLDAPVRAVISAVYEELNRQREALNSECARLWNAAQQAAPMKNEQDSYDAFVARFAANQQVYGLGADTGVSVPCPFCGAADLMRYRILDSERVMQSVHTCPECGRSCKMIVTSLPGGGTQIELVQTGGADPQSWHPTKPRRVEP